MSDEKKLRGETEHIITKAEIAAWKRGEKDAIRSKLLRAQTNVSADKAVKIVKSFAERGDVQYTSLRLDVAIEDVKRVLASFGVRSIEDARAVVREGIVAQFDQAREAEARDARSQQEADDKIAQTKLDEHKLEFDAPATKGAEVVDQTLAARQAEAQRKNKSDAIRQLISQGIDPETNTSNFKVGIQDVPMFKSMIPNGIASLRRRFGGTKQDIIREIKRIAPQYDVAMLRP